MHLPSSGVDRWLGLSHATVACGFPKCFCLAGQSLLPAGSMHMTGKVTLQLFCYAYVMPNSCATVWCACPFARRYNAFFNDALVMPLDSRHEGVLPRKHSTIRSMRRVMCDGWASFFLLSRRRALAGELQLGMSELWVQVRRVFWGSLATPLFPLFRGPSSTLSAPAR